MSYTPRPCHSSRVRRRKGRPAPCRKPGPARELNITLAVLAAALAINLSFYGYLVWMLTGS